MQRILGKNCKFMAQASNPKIDKKWIDQIILSKSLKKYVKMFELWGCLSDKFAIFDKKICKIYKMHYIEVYFCQQSGLDISMHSSNMYTY